MYRIYVEPLSFLVIVFFLFLSPTTLYSQTPPTDVWCDYVYLNDSVPFQQSQPIWWKEYYLFNATKNQTVGFKVYASVLTDAHITFMIDSNTCPMFGTNLSRIPNDYGLGTANLTFEAEAGNTYVAFVHMSGGSYTLIGCEGPCGEMCPDDCTNFQGYCDIPTGKCICRPMYEGPNCNISVPDNSTNGTTPTGKKVPFGSEAVFYSVVAGLPSVVVVTVISVIFIYVNYQKRKNSYQRRKPLLIDDQSPTPNTNGHTSLHNNHRNNGIEHLPSAPLLLSPPVNDYDLTE
jgi:hypothetical protein